MNQTTRRALLPVAIGVAVALSLPFAIVQIVSAQEDVSNAARLSANERCPIYTAQGFGDPSGGGDPLMYIVTECGDAFIMERHKITYEGNIYAKAKEGKK